MRAVRPEASVIDISKNGFNSNFTGHANQTAVRTKKLKISELKSWALSCGVISALMGLLLYLKVGVTMETITASLFFLSLGGLIYSIYQIVLLVRQPAQYDVKPVPGLN